MREKLFSRLRQQGDPRMEGKGDVFDNYPTPSPARKAVGSVQPVRPRSWSVAGVAEPAGDLRGRPLGSSQKG